MLNPTRFAVLHSMVSRGHLGHQITEGVQSMLRLRGLAQVVRVEKCIAQSALLLHTEHLQPRSPASRNVRSESTSGAVPQRNSFAAVAGSSADAARGMARSKYEYVKLFEADQPLLLGCWIVIRLDGKAFTRLSDLHSFQKPNDLRALNLMNRAAEEVMTEYPDIRLAYGESDEYSFVFHKGTELYGRRPAKLVSLVASLFSAAYARFWPQLLPDTPLQLTPSFDGRAICYPTVETLQDYLAWRQVDTHVNNQYNTCYWALVHDGCTGAEAQQMLKDDFDRYVQAQGTQTGFKNQLLYERFGINYNDLLPQFKKGSVLIWQRKVTDGSTKPKRILTTLHIDIIQQSFWQEHPDVLA